MAFTEYLFNEEDVTDLANQSALSLKQNRGFSDFEGFAASVIRDRLTKDPKRYLDYGVYWPALKEVLRKHGCDYGPAVFPMLRQVYSSENDTNTIVMADEFRKFYLATFAIGTSQFMLDPDDPNFINMIDDTMEALAP